MAEKSTTNPIGSNKVEHNSKREHNTQALNMLAKAGRYSDPTILELTKEAVELQNTDASKPLLNLAVECKGSSDPKVLYGNYLHISSALHLLDAKEELKELARLDDVKMQNQFADSLLRLGTNQALVIMRPEAVIGALKRRQLSDGGSSSIAEDIAILNPKNPADQMELLSAAADAKKQKLHIPVLDFRLKQVAEEMGADKYRDAYSRIVGTSS